MNVNRKYSLIFGSILILIIATSPYLLYIHNLLPEDAENIDTIFGVIKGGYFGTAQLYVFWFFNKFVPLLLLITLYATNKRWWGHVILIPIAVYLFQLTSVINDSEEYIDKIEFIYTIPILVIVIVPLYYLRKKLSIFVKAIDLKKEMENKMNNPKTKH